MPRLSTSYSSSPVFYKKSPHTYNFGVQSLTMLNGYTLNRRLDVPTKTNLLKYVVFLLLKTEQDRCINRKVRDLALPLLSVSWVQDNKKSD